MLFLQIILPILSAFFVGLIKADSVIHDESFIPDMTLSVTQEEKKQSCVSSKEILLVNGTSPGPELRFKEGKMVWIRVYNNVPNRNLTMHWHGLTLAAAPFSDGTPAAAQWPIPSGHFYDYQLLVPVGMAGTYFYHSHVGLQANSCTGPLIILEKDHPPYHYDDERIIFLQDVFEESDAEIEELLTATPMIYEGFQAMVLINGKGGGLVEGGAICNDSLSVINVKPGKTYRMRLIGGTGLSFDTMGIEGHEDLQVIEADGSYTDKHSTSFMQTGPGQRWSFLLHTKRKPEKQHYFIQVESREFGNVTRSFAVLNYGPRYSNSSSPAFHPPPPSSPPLTLPPTDKSFLEYQLRPRHSPTYSSSQMPTAAEVTRRVNITVHLAEPNGAFIYHLNGYPWYEEYPKEPYLVSLYKNEGYPSMERALQNDGLDPVMRAFPAQVGEVLEIVIQNTGSDGNGMESHPWHAHGAHYWDLGSGDGVYDAAANEAKWANSTGKPIKRDTTMLYEYSREGPINKLRGWRAWRLRVEQPGVWMVHCHLLDHMVWGMQTVWVMGNSTEVLGRVPRPELDGYLNYGGSVNGNKSHPPEVVDYFGTWIDEQ